jgi:AcrR family transcriptional regulator
MAKKKPIPRSQRAAQKQVRERILDTFSEKAKRSGLRSVTMGELASELRMSASTLYREFPSKEELTMACVERWARELGVAEATQPSKGRDGFERFLQWAEAWADINASLSPAFILDLRSDYPAAWRRFSEEIAVRRARGRDALRNLLKPGLDEQVAFAVLRAVMDHFLRPDSVDRLPIPRREAIRQAVAIWAGGALKRQAKLRALPGGKPR